MPSKTITLVQLRKAVSRAFGRGSLSRARLHRGGELLLATERGSAMYSWGTSITVYHSTNAQIARSRLLRILAVLANRRERRLRSGNVFCWSKP